LNGSKLECIQVPDGKNKFTVMAFFKSVNINSMAEAWAQISQSYIIGF
jgi:hypothetical protein